MEQKSSQIRVNLLQEPTSINADQESDIDKSSVQTDYTAQMVSAPHDPAAPNLDLQEEFMTTEPDDKGQITPLLNLIANKLKQGEPPKTVQRETPSLSQKDIEKMMTEFSDRRKATYNNISQPSSFDLETKMRECIRQNTPTIQHLKVDSEFSDFVQEHRTEDTNDTTHVELFPKPGDPHVAFAVLTGCKWREKVLQKFYKITHEGEHGNENIIMKKIGEDFISNQSSPVSALHEEMYASEIGLIQFQVQAQNGKKGPFKICLKQFEFTREKISDIRHITVGTKDDLLRHVYLFEPKGEQYISSQKIKYLLIWMFNKKDIVTVLKLGERNEMIHSCGLIPIPNQTPIVMFETQKTQDSQKDILFWRGTNDRMVVIEIDQNGVHEEIKDQKLYKRFREETEDMLSLSDDAKDKSHLLIEHSENQTQHFVRKDFSQAKNGEFVNEFLYEYKAIEFEEPTAILLRQNSFLALDMLQGSLYSVHLHFGICSDDIENGEEDRIVPLDFLQREEAQIVTTNYRNIAFSQNNALKENYVHMYLSQQHKWESMRIVPSLNESYKTVLQPYLQNTYQQVWYLKGDLHNITDYNVCYRGGILGTYDKIEKRFWGVVTESHKDDVTCIISEDPDGIGGEPPTILIGQKADLKKAMIVEFPKHQRAQKNKTDPVACLAIHTKQKGILTNTDGYRNTDIGEVEGIALVMLAKDKNSDTQLIAQYPIPLKHDHKLPGLDKFSQRRHYQWDFCRCSEWTKIQKDGEWFNQISYAFCEFTKDQQIVETKILRFESKGKNHKNPHFYSLGTKLICFSEPLDNKVGNVRKDSSGEIAGPILSLLPNFNDSNKISGCQIRRQEKGEESTIYYTFGNPNEQNTIFHNMLSNQTYTLLGEFGNPSVLQVEIEFSRLIQQDEKIFSERQKRNLLDSLIAVVLDMVPNQWPQDTKLQTRYLSNYECLKGFKPYQYLDLSPIKFKEAIADQSGHKTLVEKLCKDNAGMKDAFENRFPIFSNDPLLKRNQDGQTILKTFYLRQDNMMINVLAKILLDCPQMWAARDVIMSDLVVMFESEKSLSSFIKFFQNEGSGEHDDTEILIEDSPVKLQMCDEQVEFLTTGGVEQLCTVVDTTSRNPILSQREIFYHYCLKYDEDKESGKYPISPVMIDFSATEQAMIVDSIQNGTDFERINDYQVGIWIGKLINQFPQAIDSFKFPREWVDVKFDAIRWAYYVQILIYMVFLRSLYKLAVHQSQMVEGQEDEWYYSFYLRMAIVMFYTLVILVQESIQLADTGLVDYFTDVANFSETLQVVLNVIFLYQKFTHIGLNESGVNQNLVLGLICLGMTKFLTHLRVFNQLGMLVLLIFQCVADTVPFIIYLGVWLVFFVALNEIMGAKSGERLSGLDAKLSNYINMFRTTFGDIMEPIYECPEEEDCTATFLKLWLVFVVMVYFMTIILNNFLIAKVSSVYENFQQSAILTRSKNQIHLITEYLMFKQFFGKLGMVNLSVYDLIFMLQKVEGPSEESDLWEGTTKTLMRHVTKQTRDLGASISGKVATKDEVQAMVSTEVGAAMKEILEVKQGMKKEIGDVKEDITFSLNDIKDMLKKE